MHRDLKNSVVGAALALRPSVLVGAALALRPSVLVGAALALPPSVLVGAALALRLSRCKQRSYTAAILITLALLTGCAQTKNWLDKVTPGGGHSTSGTVIVGAPTADEYLETMHQLATGDPATQAEIYADAESRSTLTPDPSTNLAFALVLATPGHSESDPERAQSMFRELLTQTELMTPAEIALAEIHLKAVEERIVLGSEARRLRQSTSRQAQTEELAINQRIATVEAENRSLRRDLVEAEGKLEAITNIERSIREQEQ